MLQDINVYLFFQGIYVYRYISLNLVIFYLGRLFSLEIFQGMDRNGYDSF